MTSFIRLTLNIMGSLDTLKSGARALVLAALPITLFACSPTEKPKKYDRVTSAEGLEWDKLYYFKAIVGKHRFELECLRASEGLLECVDLFGGEDRARLMIDLKEGDYGRSEGRYKGENGEWFCFEDISLSNGSGGPIEKCEEQ